MVSVSALSPLSVLQLLADGIVWLINKAHIIRRLRTWAKVICPGICQGIMWGVTDRCCCNGADSRQGNWKLAFVLGKQLSTVKWINWWCMRFSLSSLKEWKWLLRSAGVHGGELNMWLQPTQRIKPRLLAKGLSWLQPIYSFLATGDVQRHEHKDW